jgi:N-acetyl-alpha-D-muramate 1-phosphate uridylyltransferase
MVSDTIFPLVGMVLAAGLGTRMRPLTDRLPKPLIEVGGRTLLDHAIDRLEEAGVEHVVVNAHYRAQMIADHLAKRPSPRIELSLEEELLETGGGVVRALPLLGERFFVVNSDVLWLDGRSSALGRLARAWDDATMDALLLMQETTGAVGYDGLGDYVVDPLGKPRRRREREIVPYLFAGVQLLHRRLFRNAPDGRFSLNVLYDKAQAADRLTALVHDGEWFHVGTPEGLELAERRLGTRRVER